MQSHVLWLWEKTVPVPNFMALLTAEFCAYNHDSLLTCKHYVQEFLCLLCKRRMPSSIQRHSKSSMPNYRIGEWSARTSIGSLTKHELFFVFLKHCHQLMKSSQGGCTVYFFKQERWIIFLSKNHSRPIFNTIKLKTLRPYNRTSASVFDINLDKLYQVNLKVISSGHLRLTSCAGQLQINEASFLSLKQ